MKRLVDTDSLTGIETWHEYDEASKKTYITQVQDVEPILERNRALANNDAYKRLGIKSDWYHFATVPLTVVVEFKSKYGLDIFNEDDMPKIERLLQSSDYAYLRTVHKI